MTNPTNTPTDLLFAIDQTIYTISGELALVTRANYMGRDVQLYGVYCTGKLVDSMNAAGEPNEFLLSIDQDEWEWMQLAS